MSRTIVAKVASEYGDPLEVLVILEDGAEPHIAIREKSWHSWSPPLEVVSDEEDS